MSFSLSLLAATGPGVYYAYQNSDSFGKAIVVVLILLSVVTWTIMIDKGIALHRSRKCAYRFGAFFRGNSHNLANPTLRREADRIAGPTSAIYNAGVEKLLDFYEEQSRTESITTGGIVPCKLSEAQINAIEAVLEREVSLQIQELETRIGTLGTMVSLSPFLGLFGTVWGVMMAFCGIAVAGKPDFTALAPGVAGALLTTIAGLVVAIPSLLGYNSLNASIRTTTVAMENFTDEFMARLKLEQLKISSRDPEL